MRKSTEHHRLVPAPNIQHYKPQELIRLEGEANQMRSELEVLRQQNAE
jgi:hypothetical protein